MTGITFHQLCRAGFVSRQTRTGESDADLAAAINAMYGTTYTGDDITAMHTEGYPSTVMDMVAGTIGRDTLELITQAMQMVIAGPHLACPTCSCGITEGDREAIAAAYLRNHTEGRAALVAVRESQGFQQPKDCADCGLASQTA